METPFPAGPAFPGPMRARREGPRAPGGSGAAARGPPLADKAEPGGPRRRRGSCPGRSRAPAAGAEAGQRCPGPGRDGRTEGRTDRRHPAPPGPRELRHSRARPPCSSRGAISYLLRPDPARRFPPLQAASHCAPAAVISPPPPPPPQSPQLSGPSIHLGPGRPPPPSLCPCATAGATQRERRPRPSRPYRRGPPSARGATALRECRPAQSARAARPALWERAGDWRPRPGKRWKVRQAANGRAGHSAPAGEPPGRSGRSRACALPAPPLSSRAGRCERAGLARWGRGGGGARPRWGEGGARHLGRGGVCAPEGGPGIERRIWGNGVVLSHRKPEGKKAVPFGSVWVESSAVLSHDCVTKSHLYTRRWPFPTEVTFLP